MKELSSIADGMWLTTELSSFPDAPRPHPFRWPVGYVRADGTAAMLYGDLEDNIHELTFVNGQWTHIALSQTINAPKLRSGNPHGLAACIRGDGLTAVVYHGNGGHIDELILVDGQWKHTDSSLAAGTSSGWISIPLRAS